MKRNKKATRKKRYGREHTRHMFKIMKQFKKENTELFSDWDKIYLLEKAQEQANALRPLDEMVDIFWENFLCKEEENRIKRDLIGEKLASPTDDLEDIDLPLERKKDD